MKNNFAIIVLISFLCFSCKSETKPNQVKETTKKETIQTKYQLTAFQPSKSFESANLEGMSYKHGKFAFRIGEGDYKLGMQTDDAPQKMCANSSKGQHIHLILDNAPYAAKYTSDFDYEIPDGQHHMLAFLSRSYHESIKTDQAHISSKITIKNKEVVEAEPINSPMLFYSRPKGTYVGKENTEKVMLDFYTINANIGTTQKVIASINGEKHEITKWQPYYITGLPMGENTIELTLVNNDGSKVNTPLNPVKRTFTLKADPTE